jgi:hypothetical protein
VLVFLGVCMISTATAIAGGTGHYSPWVRAGALVLGLLVGFFTVRAGAGYLRER